MAANIALSLLFVTILLLGLIFFIKRLRRKMSRNTELRTDNREFKGKIKSSRGMDMDVPVDVSSSAKEYARERIEKLVQKGF
jgi:hypothetical protein